MEVCYRNKMKKIILIFLFIILNFLFVISLSSAKDFKFYICNKRLCGSFETDCVSAHNICTSIAAICAEKSISNCICNINNLDIGKCEVVFIDSKINPNYILKSDIYPPLNLENLAKFMEINNEIFDFYRDIFNDIDDINIIINEKKEIKYIKIEGKNVNYHKLKILNQFTPFYISTKYSKLISNKYEILLIVKNGGEVNFSDDFSNLKIKNIGYSNINITLKGYCEFIAIGKNKDYGFCIEVPKEKGMINYNYVSYPIDINCSFSEIDKALLSSNGEGLDLFIYTRGDINIDCLRKRKVKCRCSSILSFLDKIFNLGICLNRINLYTLEVGYFDTNSKKFVEVIKNKDNKFYICMKCMPFGGEYEIEDLNIIPEKNSVIEKNVKILYPNKKEDIKLS